MHFTGYTWVKERVKALQMLLLGYFGVKFFRNVELFYIKILQGIRKHENFMLKPSLRAFLLKLQGIYRPWTIHIQYRIPYSCQIYYEVYSSLAYLL